MESTLRHLLGGLVFDEGLEPLLVLSFCLTASIYSMRGLRYRLFSALMASIHAHNGRRSNCPFPLPGGSGFVEDQAVPEQELDSLLLAKRPQVVLCVVSARAPGRARLAFVVGNQTSMTFPTESILARNLASLRSFFLFRSAGGFDASSKPRRRRSRRPAPSFWRSEPVTPDS